MNKIIFITGGSRSGKSTKALDIAKKYKLRGFIATAIPFDDEMKLRITKHKKERDKDFVTIEEPYNIAEAIEKLELDVDVIIIDCISVWLGNLLFKYGENESEFAEVKNLYKKLTDIKCDIIIVTNEIGMGIIPENKLARHYRDIAGFINQKLAKLSNEAFFMISGLTIKIKG